jgi:hypothetical protein
MMPMGGGVGERAGAATGNAIFRISKQTVSISRPFDPADRFHLRGAIARGTIGR